VPDSWVQLTSTPEFDQLEALADVAGLAEQVGQFFEIVSLGLQVLASLVQDDISAIRGTLTSATATVEKATEDILQTTAGVAVHTNLRWDPDWVFEDFEQEGLLPWQGSGTSGWLLDLAASARDSSDPYRPLTDRDTSVGGFIFLNGVSEGGDISQLRSLFGVFTDFDDFDEMFEVNRLEEASEYVRAATRLGPASFSSFMEEVNAVPETVLQGLGQVPTDFVPVRGAYPKWLVVPVASLVPPARELVDVIARIHDNLRMSAGSSEVLQQLVELLGRRASILYGAAERAEGVIEQLASIATFFNNTHVIYLTPETGGLENFVTRAQNASNVPVYGARGIVAGAALVVTADDPSNHVDAFLSLLGLQVEQITSNLTVRQRNLQDQYNDLFP